MFDVFGDEIVFENRTVAKLLLPNGTAREQVQSALQSYLDEDSIAKLESEAEDNGRWDGRKTQWEFDFDAIDHLTRTTKGKHKFSVEQREALLECLKLVQPTD